MGFKEDMRSLYGIHNDHNLMSAFGDKDDLACSYEPPSRQNAGGGASYAWSVHFKTDPGAAWFCHGRKGFCGGLKESLPMAIAWVNETYGARELVVSPFGRGCRLPASVVEKAKDYVKKQKAKTKLNDK